MWRICSLDVQAPCKWCLSEPGVTRLPRKRNWKLTWFYQRKWLAKDPCWDLLLSSDRNSGWAWWLHKLILLGIRLGKGKRRCLPDIHKIQGYTSCSKYTWHKRFHNWNSTRNQNMRQWQEQRSVREHKVKYQLRAIWEFISLYIPPQSLWYFTVITNLSFLFITRVPWLFLSRMQRYRKQTGTHRV